MIALRVQDPAARHEEAIGQEIECGWILVPNRRFPAAIYRVPNERT
jgi:hypothetical protein